MKLLQKKWLAACVATAAFGMSSAQASTSASVNIDWDSLNIQYFDLSGGTNAPVLSWANQNGNVYSYANTVYPSNNPYDEDYASDFTTSLSTLTNTAEAQSSTLRDVNTLSANSATQSGVAPYAGSNYAYASSQNYGNFELTGQGVAIISLDWNLSLTGTAGDTSDYSYAQAYLFGSYSDNNWHSGSATSNPNYSSYNTGDFFTSGSFVLAVISDGVSTTYGYLTAQAYTHSYSPVSQVPVPMAAWLFGSGLLGLTGMSRRKQRTA